MYTVSKLAGACGLSRSTLLYYESIGLLRRPGRTEGNYRRYGATDLARLRQICVYREAGLKLEDIRAILNRPEGDATAVLKRRFIELGAEIAALREHQRSIARLLQTNRSLWRDEMMTKEKWVAIMQAAGFNEKDMRRWHTEFEKAAPEEHQEFLQYLHINETEIGRIREWSRAEG